MAAADPNQSTIVMADGANSYAADGGTHLAIITLLQADGSPRGGAGVSLQNTGPAQFLPAAQVTDNNGQAQFYIGSQKPGVSTVTVLDSSDAIHVANTLTLSFH